MSQKNIVCIICNEGASFTNRLVSNPKMIDELFLCCKERLALGQTEMQPLFDYLSNSKDMNKGSIFYHSNCRKPLVNKTMIERLRVKRLRDNVTGGPGRPSKSTDSTRPKRRKSFQKEEVCIFASCNFCTKGTLEPLYRVLSDNMGESFIDIKVKTQNDQVRICVSDIEGAGDAFALEKYYHRKCLRYAQRTCTESVKITNQLIRSVCDEELLLSVENSLLNHHDTLSMNDVNDAYVSILQRYQVEVNNTSNYRKHLKKLIVEHLPNVHFVKSSRNNEPESIALPTAVSQAIEIRSSLLENDGIIGQLKNIANILRVEMIQFRNWSFCGRLLDFQNPPLLQFFLTHLLFGKHGITVSGVRNEEVDKTVDVACQFLVQNTRSDRQVKHQPKKVHSGFQQTVQTPLSVGLSLAIHSRIRDKRLVHNLQEVYIGTDYLKILDLEKRVEQGVLQRMKDTGGFCLPDFVKRGVNIWFAVDNIDLLEDTPTGQNTFHGTVIVLNQRSEHGDTVNPKLIFSAKLSANPQTYEVTYLQEPVIKNKPIRFDDYKLGKRTYMLSKDFNHTWALANQFSYEDNKDCTDLEEIQVSEQEETVVEERVTSNPILMLTEQCRHGDVLPKQKVMPTWAATRSLLMSSETFQNQRMTNSEVVAPLFKTSPTDYATLYTVLMLTQGISACVVGPERKTIITLDLDLYSRALHIQQSVGNKNWVLRAGALHIVFAALHALGKTIDGSGIDLCSIESGTYTSASLRDIYGGKAYKRGIEYHIMTSLAIMMMRFDDIYRDLPVAPIRDQSIALMKALHERNPEMIQIYNDIEFTYLNEIEERETIKTNQEDLLAKFLLKYLEQVDCLLYLISACRSGDWEGYLAALENIIKYFFAHDLLNYARLMPVHLAQMNALEQEDPNTWEALKSGDFVVAKSEVPFTNLFTDQTLEQKIKELKRHGGIVGLSQDEITLDRIVTITPHLAHIVKEFTKSFPRTRHDCTRSEHYHLSGEIAIRSRDNARKLRDTIEMHCVGNPFTVMTPLKSLVSSTLIPDDAKDDIFCFAEKGQVRFDEFINERLLPESTVSVWDPMKKLKLKTFSNWMEKTKVRVGDKIIKLREERELFARCLIIQRSRPELVPKLDETIGEYEMSVVPRSLCAVDGSLYIPKDKASLMHIIEDTKAPLLQPGLPYEVTLPQKVLIVDAMAVIQGMKKTPVIKTISDLQKAFIKRIEGMLSGYSEGRIVFDRYLDQSLKNKTRQKRVVSSTEFEIHSNMKLTMSLKELLSSSKTKRLLPIMFAEGLLEHFSRDFKLIVVYENKIKGNDIEQDHLHEEADTLIPNQVMASSAEISPSEVCVWSPNIDVLILLLDLVSSGHFPDRSRLKFLTGKSTKYREIDLVEKVRVLGCQKCQGLIGLHNFSGADWGGKFIDISKKTWVNAFMKLDDNDPIVDCFRKLGNFPIESQLINGELPPDVKDLEKFVCRVYSSTGPTTLLELFRSKNLEGEMLPPTRSSLLPHILRTNYIAMRDKSYVTDSPDLHPVEQNGWVVEQGVFVPVRCFALPVPRAVIELTKCSCKMGCKGLKCGCFKNRLPCTPLCKCYVGNCANANKENDEFEADEQ